MSERKSGLLLHISSLPGEEGIGTLGKGAYTFIEKLHATGVKVWQILPLGPTGHGNSPYNSFSAFAGNPLFIDCNLMAAFYQVDFPALSFEQTSKVDFSIVIKEKMHFFRSVFPKIKNHLAESEEYNDFVEKEAFWLKDYTLFMAIKNKQNNAPLAEWDYDLRLRKEARLKVMSEKLKDEILFYEFLQYEFFRQWQLLIDYANAHEIEIMGDIPVYVAYDSADVWSHPELFSLDEDLFCVKVSGVPPDYFSAEGQLWGNPVYNWEKNKAENYRWWKNRLQKNLDMFHLVRIDHFRGFSEYWSIDAGEQTAVNGKWEKGPGYDFFHALINPSQQKQIVAEDLGILSDDVRALIQQLGFPGMRVLQFAFDGGKENPHKPSFYTENTVVYTGTHDNDTLAGWISTLEPEMLTFICEYLGCKPDEMHWHIIRLALSSTAFLCILPVQDILQSGTEARMNIPGTVINNWIWRMKLSDTENNGFEKFKRFVYLYDR
ncbi:MAG: 4-alpha-glucanotransferase [Bacteroidetes bacterium HGW-Bacteroidetes-21]|jgi:4-alpha-glucanotransferase|nr:MAG: 4-alpha-glucanotransferase [Bacteroidetes bacterium HGW-Bacteroidetes-21]